MERLFGHEPLTSGQSVITSYARKWLLAGDPSVRYAVMRDLTHAPDAVVAAERSRIATEGWGSQLLALQSDAGHWGSADDEGWMTTVEALALLRDFGIDPAGANVRTAIDRVRERVTWWQLDGRPFFEGETEPCINGRILAAGAYFGEASETLVERLLADQLEDGGWNCEAPRSTRSSFHSTICVLEGLLEYERSRGAAAALTAARTRAERYLLERRMLRSVRSGEMIDRRWLRFSFPTTWHYDVLRGLDYLRSADTEPGERVAEAIDVVKKRRHRNGLWPLDHVHADRVGLRVEAGAGNPGYCNTLRALRVLRWYDGRAKTDVAQG